MGAVWVPYGCQIRVDRSWIIMHKGGRKWKGRNDKYDLLQAFIVTSVDYGGPGRTLTESTKNDS